MFKVYKREKINFQNGRSMLLLEGLTARTARRAGQTVFTELVKEGGTLDCKLRDEG